MPQVSGSSSDTALSSRARYPSFRRTIATDRGYLPAWAGMARSFGWAHVAMVVDETKQAFQENFDAEAAKVGLRVEVSEMFAFSAGDWPLTMVRARQAVGSGP